MSNLWDEMRLNEKESIFKRLNSGHAIALFIIVMYILLILESFEIIKW